MSLYPPLPDNPTWAELVPGDRLEFTTSARPGKPSRTYTWEITGAARPAAGKPYPYDAMVDIREHLGFQEPTDTSMTVELAGNPGRSALGSIVVIHPSPDRDKP
ncbi:hypothetical protein ACIBH1_45650 [Nonomuraea sp. NPDC050663]|uniref:hypothetical protein n=1 Tax=Nonomuraea sp. NPDC050663 TaxID=3364370 RepID=UPI0037B0FF89